MDRAMDDSLLVLGRRLAVGSVLFAALCSGVASVDPVGFKRTELLARGALALAAALWCATDATLRRRYDLWHAQWQLWAVWPLYGPIYLVATRRWRGAALVLAVVVSLILAYFTGRGIGGFAGADT